VDTYYDGSIRVLEPGEKMENRKYNQLASEFHLGL
jgi:hypothetical protein